MFLFPFQDAGAAHLQSGRVKLLADEMGLGKTAQAVRASELDVYQKVNVICPAILAREWKAEFAEWGDVPRGVAVLGDKKGIDPEKADVLITSFDRTTRPEVAELLTHRRRGGFNLIIDEGHFLKSAESARTLAIFGEDATGRHAIAEGADRISWLTGTPAPNVAAELYVMLKSAGLWDGGPNAFAHRYCYVRVTRYGDKAEGLRQDRLPELRQMLSGFMLRRTNAVELPSTDYGELIVEPSDIANADLSELKRLDLQAGGVIERAKRSGDFSTLETPHIAKLRRMTGLAKCGAVIREARELLQADKSNKLVLFCQHRTVIEIITRGLADFKPVQLVGGDLDKKRKRLKDQFQADAETRVAVCQMKAAGAGITLTAANHLWIVEPSWTPADNDQATKRIVRIGQKRRTSVKFVSLKNSIDQAVNGVLRKKRNLIDLIINQPLLFNVNPSNLG